MNTKITLLCISAAVVGLTWWCWRVAAPDLPVSTAPVQTHAKSVAASPSFQTPSPKGAATTSQSAGLNVPAISNPATPGKTTETMTGGRTPIANANSPASNLAETSLPAQVYLTVPLENAEHQTLTPAGAPYPLDVSIVAYYHITRGPNQGEEVVDYHVWSGWGRDGSQGGDVRGKPFSAFSSEEQGNIRNWAQQQAATSPAATTPVNGPTVGSQGGLNVTKNLRSYLQNQSGNTN